MCRFCPVHNHSEFSALDGLSTCMEIADRALEMGVEAAGITDHGTVSGHLEFAKVMNAKGLKPIFGCELYHGIKTEFGKNERDQAHFVVGALTDEGLKNVWRLVDAASTNFRYVGRVTFDMCREHSEGVFATSACIQGLVAQGIVKDQIDPYAMLNNYLDIYGERFFIEIHTYPGLEHEVLNTELVRIARERGVGLVYATDAHFAFKRQYKTHDAYVAMSTGESVLVPPAERKMWHPNALYMQDEAEIRESLSYLPEDAVDEALANSALIADMVDAQLPAVKRHLPTFVPAQSPWLRDDETRTAAELFVDLVEAGLERRYPDGNPEAWKRAEEEMETYLSAPGPTEGGGLEHYFLQTWDFVQYCKERQIERGPGRGSAGGSIVAYALEITDIDPLYYGLYSERFYNPGRAKGFPDIDQDFPKAARTKLREYAMQRWGGDKVSVIGTTRRLKPKDAIDKTYKAYGLTWEEKEAVKAIVDQVPDLEILGSDSIGWARDTDPGKLNPDGTTSPKRIYVMEHVGERILEWVEQQPGRRQGVLLEWLVLVELVCSRVAGYGVHPSGVVVAEVPLADWLPRMWNANQKVQVTCFPMDDVDALQFVKQDFLGLRNLDTLEDWRAQIGEDAPMWSGLERLPSPPEMWSLLELGFTYGIFQIEDGYGRHLCKELKPTTVLDLAAIVALNRPGPIRSGAVKSYLARHKGEEEVAYDHPLLEEILEETKGIFLYQEQVIRFCEKLGYSKSEADAVRKMIGKKSPEDMRAFAEGMGEWQAKGYMAMAAQAGIPADVATTIIHKIEEFALYSFNKSHAVAYAVLAFRTAYAKLRLPNFIISSIRTMGDDPKKAKKTSGFIGEGRRLGVSTNPPDIRRAEADASVQDGQVYFGFANIKGIGKGSAQYICALRELWDIETRSSLEDALGAEQKVWCTERDLAKAEGRRFYKKSPSQMLPANRIEALWKVGAFDQYEARQVTFREQQQAEKELLGVILTDDSAEVMARNQDEIEECDAYAELDLLTPGQTIRLPGTISQIVPKSTRKEGKAMGIVTIEYEGGEVEFAVFPREWKTYRSMWKDRVSGIFTLCRTERGIHFDRGHALS